MEINHRQQDKYSSNSAELWLYLIDGTRREINFFEIEKAVKDFCFVRHELSNYSYLYASHLNFHVHLTLPYWEYLFLNGQINQSDKDELEEGALLVLYLYFKEIYEAEGACFLYTKSLFKTIEKTVNLYSPDSDRKRQIINKIKFARLHCYNGRLNDQNSVQLSDEEENLRSSLLENDMWVYQEFVVKYYIDKVKSFNHL
ncbi:hypothetical protein [Telluribacter sp. SYSU D00476]|uniref:hypothetical protein n=1 Tax=Telluribacter sp. SYSU D00476 TaxID=2811430 RepID=UPI001FF370A3|nr:hypothetical protein [Telluribacter sp. SYSU D00476]